MKFNSAMLKNTTKTIARGVEKKAPEILLALGIGSGAYTLISGVNSTVKAVRLVDAAKEERQVDALGRKETVQLVWKEYLETMIMAGVTTGLLISSNIASNNQKAVIATAYTLTNTAFNEYKNATTEVVGEEKERDIRTKVAENRMERVKLNDQEVISTGKGEDLCYDSLTGRLFKSDMNTIKAVENWVNGNMLNGNAVTLNDLYCEFGLDQIGLFGERNGWHINDGMLTIVVSTMLTKSGKPCLYLDYDILPSMLPYYYG